MHSIKQTIQTEDNDILVHHKMYFYLLICMIKHVFRQFNEYTGISIK